MIQIHFLLNLFKYISTIYIIAHTRTHTQRYIYLILPFTSFYLYFSRSGVFWYVMHVDSHILKSHIYSSEYNTGISQLTKVFIRTCLFRCCTLSVFVFRSSFYFNDQHNAINLLLELQRRTTATAKNHDTTDMQHVLLHAVVELTLIFFLFLSHAVAMELRTDMPRSRKSASRRSSKRPGRFPCKSTFNFVPLQSYIVPPRSLEHVVPLRKHVETNELYSALLSFHM